MDEQILKQWIFEMVDCGCHEVSLEAVERVAKYLVAGEKFDKSVEAEEDADLLYNFVVFDRKLEVKEK